MKRRILKQDFGSHPDVYGRLAWDKPAVTLKRECAHVGNEDIRTLSRHGLSPFVKRRYYKDSPRTTFLLLARSPIGIGTSETQCRR